MPAGEHTHELSLNPLIRHRIVRYGFNPLEERIIRERR